eukprot:g65748.t1
MFSLVCLLMAQACERHFWLLLCLDTSIFLLTFLLPLPTCLSQRTSAPLSLSRSHTSYEYFGFLNFLRLHCPPPSGVTILSGESFRLRKSRFWTWVDFKLSYANDALPEIDRQLYNRSALSILDSTPSAAVPTHFTQSKRNHKRGQQELKQAHDYNMLTHDKFKYAESVDGETTDERQAQRKKQKTLKRSAQSVVLS